MRLPPNDKKEFRQQLERYLLVAEKYNYVWHYSQNRPVFGYHLAPSATHWADCSSFVSLSFYAAGQWSRAPVSDPTGMHYSGYGNTGSIYAFIHAHHAPPDKYLRGDIALYLQAGSFADHVTVCCMEGTAESAWFMSFGSESGPQKRKLRYRSDLTGVYRHPALL